MDSMERLNKAIQICLKKFHEDNGEDAELQEGDSYPVVFNDGIVIVSLQNKEVGVNIILGKPAVADFDLELEEKV